MTLPQLSLSTWIVLALVGALIGAGIWAFGVGKPARVTQLEIGLRLLDDERAEIGLRETDHKGQVFVYEVSGALLDFSLVDRPRSIQTDPVILSNDTKNVPSRARITLRGLSDEDVKLGLRTIRPNRRWTSTRFPRPEPIRPAELSRDAWFYYPPLHVGVLYHQPLVDGVRLLIYIAGAFAALGALCWIIWRRWLN